MVKELNVFNKLKKQQQEVIPSVLLSGSAFWAASEEAPGGRTMLSSKLPACNLYLTARRRTGFPFQPHMLWWHEASWRWALSWYTSVPAQFFFSADKKWWPCRSCRKLACSQEQFLGKVITYFWLKERKDADAISASNWLPDHPSLQTTYEEEGEKQLQTNKNGGRRLHLN